MKVSLEEALKRATPGPLKRRGHTRRIEGGSFGRLVCEFPYYSQSEARIDANIATIVHAFNHFPEVVEALKACLDALDDYESDALAPKGFAHLKAEEILSKASTIELPN